MPTITTAPTAAPVKRRWRNFLLDARFQLKFTGYNLAMALFVAAVLFLFLFGAARTLMHETELAVEAREKAAETSKELSTATLNNKLIERINDPAFEKELSEQSQKIDQRFDAERRAIVEQKADLVRRQRLTWLVLAGCLLAFVVFITLTSIITTHKIAGPLFRIKRMVQDVAAGKLALPSRPLRDGDEMQDLFEAVTAMLQSLRDQQSSEVAALAQCLEQLDKNDPPALAAQLRALEEKMKARLN